MVRTPSHPCWDSAYIQLPGTHVRLRTAAVVLVFQSLSCHLPCAFPNSSKTHGPVHRIAPPTITDGLMTIRTLVRQVTFFLDDHSFCPTSATLERHEVRAGISGLSCSLINLLRHRGPLAMFRNSGLVSILSLVLDRRLPMLALDLSLYRFLCKPSSGAQKCNGTHKLMICQSSHYTMAFLTIGLLAIF